MVGKLGQKLAVDCRVRIARTGDASFDGISGSVLGTYASEGGCDFLIIGLDEPYNGQKAIVMIESCLDNLSNH